MKAEPCTQHSSPNPYCHACIDWEGEATEIERLGNWVVGKGHTAACQTQIGRDCTCYYDTARELAKRVEEELDKLNEGFIEVAGWWNTAVLDRDEFKSKLSTAEAERDESKKYELHAIRNEEDAQSEMTILRARVEELEVPIRDFINKVNTGRAHSVDSYAKFLAVMFPLPPPDTGEEG